MRVLVGGRGSNMGRAWRQTESSQLSTACRAFVLKLDFIFSSSPKPASHGAV